MTSRGVAVLLGGSLGDVPLVHELHRAGLRVVTVGGDATGAAHREADEHVLADFSDPDICTEVARERGAVAVVPGSNDFAAISGAVVAGRLGLPGHDPEEVVRTLNLKERFRTLQADLGLPYPAFRRAGTSRPDARLAATLRLPVLVKPTDLTGGKGIRTVERWDDLKAAVEAAQGASRRQEVLVEEYLPGTRHGVTTIVSGGRVTFDFFDDEQYEPGGFRVVGATAPSSLTSQERDEVRRQLDLLVERMWLSDGLLHAQLIRGPDGPVLVEATRRLPGDLYARFVELSSGFAYTRAVVAPYLGAPVPSVVTGTAVAPIGRWVVVSDGPGPYRGLSIGPALADAVIEIHHAFDPETGAVARAGLTVAVLMVDLLRLTPDFPAWSGTSPVVSVLQ